ncbi:MAG: glycosyltransferase family 4 protein [Clostridia bacterium]|nr:glycosyltransferase family 4 protein [Clostridia bacterium]
MSERRGDPTKILITTTWYAPVINGVVTSVLNLKRGLEELGHEVRVLTLSRNIHSHREGDVTFVGSVSAGKLYPNARMKMTRARQLVKDLIDWRPDIVHSQCEFNGFHAARKIAEACGAPLVHTYHTVYEDYTHYFSPSERLGKSFVKALSRAILNKTDIVIAPTRKVEELLRGYRVAVPIVTVPSGLDLSRFDITDIGEKSKAIRRDLGIGDEKRVLVYLGRLAKEKNTEELIYLLKEENDPDMLLVIVGGGPYGEELEEFAEAMGVSDRVIFVGMVPPEDVVYYYRLGDVFVSASQSETQGMTYVEAMASGQAILCKKDPCLTELVTDGVDGFQYTTKNEFSELLAGLFESEEYRRKIGDAAAESVREKYSIGYFARSVLDVYETALNERKTKEVKRNA